MTGYIVNTGATAKFSEGWDRIFGGGPQSAKKSAATSQAKPAKKTPANAKPGVKKSPAAKARTAKPAKTVKSKRAAQTTRTSGKR